MKNYSGEQNVGLDSYTRPVFIWHDRDLKRTMGY